MSEAINIVDIPKPLAENPLGQQAARLVLQELGDEPAPTDKRLESQCAGMDKRLVLAALSPENVFLGTGSLLLYRHECGLIAAVVDLAVEKAARQRGVATQLLRRLEASARVLRAPETCLQPTEGNEDFYIRRGYRETTRPYFINKVYVKPLV